MLTNKCLKCSSLNTYSRRDPPRAHGEWKCNECGYTWERRPVQVRERPLVAEYLATIEAPSQATPDEEVDRVAAAVAEAMPDMHAFASDILPKDYTLRIDRMKVGVSCAACDRPVLEQVDAAARSNTDMMEAMQRGEKHRAELTNLLGEVVEEAHAAEDAGDFVLWVQDRLAAYRKRG